MNGQQPVKRNVDKLSNLPENVRALCKHSIEARKKAYAPYSKFYVGAALLTTDGNLVTGNKQIGKTVPRPGLRLTF